MLLISVDLTKLLKNGLGDCVNLSNLISEEFYLEEDFKYVLDIYYL